MTLKGRPLPEGGTIGVPAPSSPYHNRSEVLRGVEWWQKRGYKVKLGAGIFDRHAYVAGDPKARAEDINALFADPEIDVIQCFQGGYGAAQTIPHLDLDLARDNPKSFVGYSDITSLHLVLHHHAELVTFYGPGLASMGSKERKPFTFERLLRALTSLEPLGEVPRNPDDEYLRPLGSGKVTAPLVGGCLSLIGQAMGTPWQLDLEGKIFFFEDYDAPPWYIDGILNQMKLAGALDGVVGVIVGELEKCDWREDQPEFPQSLSIEDVLELYIEPLGVPALYGHPLGHGTHLATLPLGLTATLDAEARRLSIDEPALSPSRALRSGGDPR